MNPLSMADLLPLVPEGFLLASLCILLLADLFIPQSERSTTHWLTVAVLAFTAILVWRADADTSLAGSAFSGMFLNDGVATICKLFILLTSALALIYARPYLIARKLFQGEFYTLTGFAVLGIVRAPSLFSGGRLRGHFQGVSLRQARQFQETGDPRFPFL